MSRLHAVPSPPAFFLARTPDEGEPRLLEGEADHALKSRRLEPGQLCLGLDGHGHRWPLRVGRQEGRTIELEIEGPADFEPPPGADGAPLPWVEVAVAWPKKPRAEGLIGALVQLGAAAITPLEARFRGPEPCPADPPARWEKLAREACKQSGRAWMPTFSGRRPTIELVQERREAGAALAFLEPRGPIGLDTWLRSLTPAPLGVGSEARPIVLFIGPEGGFAPDEREAFLEAGASPAHLGPHVLRIETAAAAAMAAAAILFGGRPTETRA